MPYLARKWTLILFTAIFASLTFLCSFHVGSMFAINSLSISQGSNFTIAPVFNDEQITVMILGDVYNPSYFPVHLHEMTYDLYINRTYLYTGQINGSVINPQRSSQVEASFITNLDEMPLKLMEEVIDPYLMSFRESSGGYVLKLEINGTFEASALWYSTQKDFHMTWLVG